MALSNPIAARTLGQWLKHLVMPRTLFPIIEFPTGEKYFPALLQVYEAQAAESSSNKPFWLIKKIFLETYGFDGYDPATGRITSAHGQSDALYTSDSLPLGLAIASFLGFPSRPEEVVHGAPALSWKQPFWNLVGGWNPFHLASVDKSLLIDSPEKIMWRTEVTEKKVWQVIASPIKLLLIAPIKLLTIPLKLLLNTLKLATEFLPSLIMNVTGKLLKEIPGMWSQVWSNKRTLDRDPLSSSGVGLRLFGLVIATVIAIPLHYLSRIVFIVGRAATSPEKSARRAFEVGRALRVGGEKTSAVVGAIVGGIAAVLSLALSAAVWIFTLPLLYFAIADFFPALFPLLTSISQWPLIAPMYTAVTGGMASLVAAFAPAATAMLGYFSLHIAATALSLSLSIAIITPAIAIASRVADELSNVWARWSERAPVTRVIKFFSEFSGTVFGPKGEGVELDKKKSQWRRPKPGREAKNLVENKDKGFQTARKFWQQVDNRSEEVSGNSAFSRVSPPSKKPVVLHVPGDPGEKGNTLLKH